MKKTMLKAYMFVQGMHRKQEGQGMVEYGLILALIAVVVIGVLATMGGRLGTMFSNVSNNL